jgi:hypothetical protein
MRRRINSQMWRCRRIACSLREFAAQQPGEPVLGSLCQLATDLITSMNHPNGVSLSKRSLTLPRESSIAAGVIVLRIYLGNRSLPLHTPVTRARPPCTHTSGVVESSSIINTVCGRGSLRAHSTIHPSTNGCRVLTLAPLRCTPRVSSRCLLLLHG